MKKTTVDTQLYSYVASEETYPDKAVIIKEGATGNWAYLILEGQVKVKKKTPKGIVKIATLRPGAIFGDTLFLQMKNDRRTASVVADGPVTVGLLDMTRLDQAYRSVSPLLKVLISTIAKRMEGATEHLITLSLK